jgi:hypothetical protein
MMTTYFLTIPLVEIEENAKSELRAILSKMPFNLTGIA